MENLFTGKPDYVAFRENPLFYSDPLGLDVYISYDNAKKGTISISVDEYDKNGKRIGVLYYHYRLKNYRAGCCGDEKEDIHGDWDAVKGGPAEIERRQEILTQEDIKLRLLKIRPKYERWLEIQKKKKKFLHIKATICQTKKIHCFLEKQYKEQENLKYQVVTKNCSKFVHQALKAGFPDLPSTGIFTDERIYPGGEFSALADIFPGGIYNPPAVLHNIPNLPKEAVNNLPGTSVTLPSGQTLEK